MGSVSQKVKTDSTAISKQERLPGTLVRAAYNRSSAVLFIMTTGLQNLGWNAHPVRLSGSEKA